MIEKIPRFGLAICLLALACATSPQLSERRGGLDLYFLRHAQTLSNVTKVYSVENQRTFSPQGQREIREISEKLHPYRFDAILVSPTYRTLHTIAPYLAESGAVAEIWPEIEECCFQKDRESPPSDHLLRKRRPIALAADLAERFRFRDAAAAYWSEPQNYADSLRQVDLAYEQIRKRFGGSGKSVLLVTHFMFSARLIALLTGDEAAADVALRTGTLTHLREVENGRFELVTLNDAAFAGVY